jgi:hypothetical protein
MADTDAEAASFLSLHDWTWTTTELEEDDSLNGRQAEGRGQIAGFACLRKGVKRYSNPPLLHLHGSPLA